MIRQSAWDVWHGSQLPYQTGYKDTGAQSFTKEKVKSELTVCMSSTLAGRFVSEFGMQALPSATTMETFMQDAESEYFIQSKTFEDQ